MLTSSTRLVVCCVAAAVAAVTAAAVEQITPTQAAELLIEHKAILIDAR